MIFPDKQDFDPFEPKMAKTFGYRIDALMPVREYEHRKEEHDKALAERKAWFEANPFESWSALNENKSEMQWNMAAPRHPGSTFRPDEWKVMDYSNVYFDEASKMISDQIKHHNRIAMIIQGLFDRSKMLQPHNGVKSWTPEGFAAAIELIYDANYVLTFGDEPDFEAYIEACNSRIDEQSIVTGQHLFWRKKGAEKEMERRRSDYRLTEAERYREIRFYAPYGNPGPDDAGPISQWKQRSRKAVFRWEREKISAGSYGETVPCSVTVPASELFNISAYRPGDFKQFFQDPRTRAKYLKWAHFLMTAEDWWAKQPADN